MTLRVAKIFNRIAPIYGMFFASQVVYYQGILAQVQDSFNINDYQTVLDVGCGTGALCQAVHNRGLQVTGIDLAEKMLQIARQKLSGTNITLAQGSILETTQFPDQSFDLVMASYVVHGAKLPERLQMYREMKRLAKHFVIIHDYNDRRSLMTNIVEWLEGGGYFDFIKHAPQEMQKVFSQLRIINVDTRAAWYIGKP